MISEFHRWYCHADGLVRDELWSGSAVETLPNYELGESTFTKNFINRTTIDYEVISTRRQAL